MAVTWDVSLSKEKLMDRRTFLISSGVTGLGALFASPDSGHAAETQSPEIFSWNTGELSSRSPYLKDASGSTSSCRQVSRPRKIPRVEPV
jgi:hypothetical protein